MGLGLDRNVMFCYNTIMDDLDKIHAYFRDMGKRNPWVGIFQLGISCYPASCVFDCVLVDCQKSHIRGLEFKVTRADFLQDKNAGKWKKYLRWCHTFTWVCPEGLIQPNEIEKPAGLLWVVDKSVKYYGGTERTRQGGEWKKRPSSIEIERSDYDKVVMMLLNRVKWRKEAFY